MATVDAQIYAAADNISDNIAACGSDRNLMARNIIKNLRDLTEAVAVRVHTGSGEVEYNYTSIHSAVRKIGNTKRRTSFLYHFHKLLQQSESHYSFGGDIAERLMLKYHAYLIRIRELLSADYGIEILANLEDFPTSQDPALAEFHEKIAARINEIRLMEQECSQYERYYIQSVRPFVVDGRIFYEVTFSGISEYQNKSDRHIAFADFEIAPFHAVQLKLINSNIEVLGRRMPILVVCKWQVSIRPIELINLGAIFNEGYTFRRSREYIMLMAYLTETGSSLLTLIDSDDDNYSTVCQYCLNGKEPGKLFRLLHIIREFVKTGKPGTNIVRYLLYRTNHAIIRAQKANEGYDYFSNLRITRKARPFDVMPFAANPAGHVPRISDLLACFDTAGREHELLARKLKMNAEQSGVIFTPAKELERFEDIDGLVREHNSRIPSLKPSR